MTQICTVTAEAVWVPADCDRTVDVVFGEHRVWSFLPTRDGRRDGSRLRVPWPAALSSRLVGTGRVLLREHVDGRVLFDDQVRLGDSDQPLRVVSKSGEPMAVDKTGRLQRMFTARDQAMIDSLLDGVEEVLTILRTQGGVEAFLAFGCLLGAVRDGRMIGHDCDADLGYVSRRTHPLDVTLESFELERVVQRAGFETHRMSSDDFKVHVSNPGGGWTGVDVFGGFYTGGLFHLMPNVRGDLPLSSIAPTSTVTLEGRKLAAPADPAALLALTYGAGWQVPDPAFHYAPPRSTRRRLGGWMRGENDNRRRWVEFYNQGAPGVPDEPSGFCRWILDSGRLAGQVVDVGCGTGRDSRALADAGSTVVGLDYAGSAVPLARKRSARHASVEFDQLNLYETREVLAVGARLAHRFSGAPVDVYARLLLSAVNDAGRANFWCFARMLLPLGGRIFCEFRTPQDRKTSHAYGGPGRHYLDPRQVVEEAAAIGAEVEDLREGRGLAVLRGEDPHVCQLVLKGR